MRTVVVTGGGRGIGASISRAFHALGDEVVILARDPGAFASTLGGNARGIRCDVRQPSDLMRAMEAAAGPAGRVDVLVNNAGSSGWRPLEHVDEAFWDEMLAVNLKSVFFATRSAVPHMSAGGVIVNVSSLAGKRGSANNAVYCAAKFGVTGLTQALAKELGARGVRVNAVCPVYVGTEGLRDALAESWAPPKGGDIDAYLATFAREQAALGRMPLPDEVANACVFLASDAASAITGQSLNVDCGVMPQ